MALAIPAGAGWHILPLVVLLAGGCGGLKRDAAGRAGEHGSRTIVTPSEATPGRVLSVDQPGRFVVLSFPPGRVPEPERRFDLYRHGLKVAEVRVGGPRTGDNTVADVVTGEAQPGDEARPQ